MKTNRIKLPMSTIALIAVATLCVTPIFGQGMGGMGGGGMGMGGMGMGGGLGAPMSPLDQLKESLRTAKGDAAQKKILAKINSMLSKQYDSYLQQNEIELQVMERSVKALRTQLERRKDAKGQLLKLELQRIANEASGLVWPEDQSGMSGMGGMGMGGMGGMGMGGMGDDDASVEYYTPEPTGPIDGFGQEPDTVTHTMNQLRQIVLAALNFESANLHFPHNIQDDTGKPLLSWRVEILQYLGDAEQALYKKFKLDEPWNSEHNVELLEEMPEAFKQRDFDSKTKTVFLGFEGKDTMFEPGKEITFGQISDGSSNTLCVAQVNRQSAVPWTKPTDVKFAPGTPVTQLAETDDGSIIISRCDGSATQIKLEKIDSKNLEHLIQINDGIVVSIDE